MNAQPELRLKQSPTAQKTINVIPRINEHRDVWSVLSSDISSALPITGVDFSPCLHDQPCKPCLQRNRRELVGAFDRSVKGLAKVHGDFQSLLENVLDQFVWGNSWEKKLYEEKKASLAPLIHLPPLEVADVMDARIMAMPVDETWAFLREVLEENTGILLQSVRARLDELKGVNGVGGIEWYSNDACMYYFFRTWRTERTQTKTKTVEEEEINASTFPRTYTEFRTTYQFVKTGVIDVLERHEHHLFNAARYQCPATMVRKPAFIERFVSRIPEMIMPHTFIVEGDMLRDDVQRSEEVVREEKQKFKLAEQIIRQGELMSPAVVLGEYVLGGWRKEELKYRRAT